VPPQARARINLLGADLELLLQGLSSISAEIRNCLTVPRLTPGMVASALTEQGDTFAPRATRALALSPRVSTPAIRRVRNPIVWVAIEQPLRCVREDWHEQLSFGQRLLGKIIGVIEDIRTELPRVRYARTSDPYNETFSRYPSPAYCAAALSRAHELLTMRRPLATHELAFQSLLSLLDSDRIVEMLELLAGLRELEVTVWHALECINDVRFKAS
jgi:hypothetical protein